MQIQPAKILSAKRITLPDQFLKENDLKEGDFVGILFSNGKVTIQPIKVEVKR